MTGPQPARAAKGLPGPGLQVELKLTALARPPSPDEERAISLAVEEALRRHHCYHGGTDAGSMALLGTLVACEHQDRSSFPPLWMTCGNRWN